jgi:hypothetical protein
MKTAGKAIRTVVVLTIIGGLCYSVSALMSESVHASSCDCVAELAEAHQFCQDQFGNNRLSQGSWMCLANGPDVNYQCWADPHQVLRFDPCNDD